MNTKKLISGNEAVVEGALKIGMRFYAGYPITPASEIMEHASEHKELGFVNAEDEIASISMIIGASLAGSKAMTATSGPGFSLMQEGLGLAHMMRVPIVVVNSQRVGPSTGMPTLAAQGDILQAYHGSHGDYLAVALYPNSVEECFKYAIEAFNLAEEARIPVIILIDGFISHLYEGVDLEKIDIKIVPRSFGPLGTDKRHFTGLLSKDNSPATRDSEYYREWFANYKKEVLDAAKRYRFYEFIENKNSDKVIVCFGIASRIVYELKNEYSIFRPITMFPVLPELVEICSRYKEVIVVEMNDGQYAGILEKKLKREIKKVNVLGGKITIEDVEKEIARIGMSSHAVQRVGAQSNESNTGE